MVFLTRGVFPYLSLPFIVFDHVCLPAAAVLIEVAKACGSVDVTLARCVTIKRNGENNK